MTFADRIDEAVEPQAVDAGHRPDGLAAIAAVNEDWPDQVFDQ